MTVASLPIRDAWTTYDYEEGCTRRKHIKEGKIKISPIILIDCPDLPIGPSKCYQVLRVESEGNSQQLKFLSCTKTREFALTAIEKWGKINAELVLSATETGSLYYHIIYYYRSYENFLKLTDYNERDFT